METVQVIFTKQAPPAIGPYSQAIVWGRTVWTSGQIAIDPATGEMVPGGVAAQTRQVIANLKAVLAAAGASLEDVVKTTVFLTDLAAFGEMNEVYAAAFTGKPARSTVQVSALPKGALVEIECVAILKGKEEGQR